MMDMRSRKIARKTNDASGKGLSGVCVVVLFFPMVFINLSSNSNSPTIITITEMKARPISRNASCNKKENFPSSSQNHNHRLTISHGTCRLIDDYVNNAYNLLRQHPFIHKSNPV